jgi:hypothetical protein
MVVRFEDARARRNSITNTLIRHLGRPELADDIRKRMGLRTRIQWARRMTLVPAKDLDFIDALSAIRNDLAHHISSIPGFDLGRAFHALDTGLKKKLFGEWEIEQAPSEMVWFRIWLGSMGLLVAL